MSDLMQNVIAEISKLPEDQQDEIATWILERLAEPELQTEAEWEAKVVRASLGDALNPDGSLDFDKLTARAIPMTLDELYPEYSEVDEL